MRIVACCKLQIFFIFVVEPMAGIVDDQEVLWAVEIADEVADVTIELVLRFLSDVQLDKSGIVMEAVAEEGLKLYSLRESVKRGICEDCTLAHLILGFQLVQIIRPLYEQHGSSDITFWLVHAFLHFGVPKHLHFLSSFQLFDFLRTQFVRLERLACRSTFGRRYRFIVVINALYADIGVDDLVLERVRAGVHSTCQGFGVNDREGHDSKKTCEAARRTSRLL